MIKLLNSLDAWQSALFSQTLKNELEQLLPGSLPLYKAVRQGGYVDDNHVTTTILSFGEDAQTIQAKAGIFYTEIVVNCGCGDDPMETNAYCELQIWIDKTSGKAEFEVLPDKD